MVSTITSKHNHVTLNEVHRWKQIQREINGIKLFCIWHFSLGVDRDSYCFTVSADVRLAQYILFGIPQRLTKKEVK